MEVLPVNFGKVVQQIPSGKNFGFTYRVMSRFRKDPRRVGMIYSMVIDNLERRFGEDNVYFVYEDQKKDGGQCDLHIHGTVVIREEKKPHFLSLMHPECHSHWEPLYDQDGWTRYMTKNSSCQAR